MKKKEIDSIAAARGVRNRSVMRILLGQSRKWLARVRARLFLYVRARMCVFCSSLRS